MLFRYFFCFLQMNKSYQYRSIWYPNLNISFSAQADGKAIPFKQLVRYKNIDSEMSHEILKKEGFIL